MKKITLQLIFAMLTTFVAFSQGSQNFETQTALTSTYEDGNFTENGITYTYVHSRDEGLGTNDDYSITGKGLMLRRASNPSSLEWTIPNGIGTLTFDARKAFTGGNNNRQLEVLVNGTSVWTSPMFGTSGTDDTIHNFSVIIEEEGSTTINIKIPGTSNSNRQVTIDNISWTVYPAASSCSPITSLGTSNITTTSVDVSWTAGGTETSWNVEYGVAGFTQGNGTTISVSSANASITGLTANTSYDVYVQADCGSGNQSTWEMVNFTTDNVSYCVPSATDIYDYTSAFSTLNGITNITYTASDFIGNGYNDLSNDLTQIITSVAGQQIDFSHTYYLGSHTFRIWIDWNNDGAFDGVGEEVVSDYSSDSNYTGFFNIPINTNAGSYRMRIRSKFAFSSTSTPAGACSVEPYGQAVDFTLVINTTTPCAGTPNAGTITVNPAIGNAGETYSVTAIGYDTNSGLTFQWEIYNENTSSWEEIGTSSSTYQSLTGQVAPDDIDTQVKYRLKLTCTNSSETAYSNEATFTTGKVYCTPNFGLSSGYIKTFETTGGSTNINNETNAQSQNGYGDFTSQSVVVTAGASFDFSATSQDTNGWAIWIDWNDNGVFDADERVFNTTGYVGNIAGTINVPISALGIYTMRVMCNYTSTNPTDPCFVGLVSSGEVEDYTIDVQGTCSPITSLGTSNITTTSVDLSWTAGGTETSWNLEYGVVGFAQGSGTTISVSSANASITGLTANTSYDVYIQADCGSGNQSTWEMVNFTTDNVSYCVPGYPETSDYTSEFSTSVNGTTFANYTASSQTGTNGYNDLSIDPSYNTTALVGGTINFSHTFFGSFLPASNTLRIWVDWNNDGIFENSEMMISDNASGIIKTGSFSVPNDQAPGNYRMRVRSRWNSFAEACSIEGYGQALDMTIVVNALTACSGTPNAGTITINPATANAGETFSVSAIGYNINTGLTFQWQKYNDATSDWEDYGTPSLVYQDLNGEIAPANINDQVKYRLKLTCTNSNEFAYSNEATFTTVKIYCTPSYTNLTDYTSLFQTTNLSTNMVYTATSQTGTAGYNDLSSDTSYYITQTAGELVSFTHTYGANFQPENNTVRIWVDWNNNGIFEDGEMVVSDITSQATKTLSFTIPDTTLAGDYRLRMRSKWNSDVVPNACLEYGYGQALDFTLVVTAAFFSDCPDPLNAGIVSVTPDTGNSGSIFDVTATGYDTGNEITYTWEKTEDNGASWIFVGTPNNPIYADLIGEIAPDSGVVEYRLTVTCGGNTASATGTFTTTVNVATFDLFGFRYHPNPVNDMLYFTTNAAIENVSVSNMLGQQIKANLSSDKTSLDMSNLASGNYFVKVTIEGVSKTIKVIKN